MAGPLLVLGHAADRTGPPIYLLHWLRWLRDHRPDVDVEIALLAGGPLLEDFEELGPTSVYEGLPPTRWDDDERTFLLRRLDLADRWWASRREQQLRRQMRRHAHCEVVYINSAPSAELARLLPAGSRTLLSHVHDLEIGLTHRLDPRDRAVLLDDATQVYAVSEAVRTNLIERHQVDPAKIVHHSEMIEARAVSSLGEVDDRSTARQAKGLPARGTIVGSCGTLDWRKAVDLFLRLAWHLTRAEQAEPTTFVWVGGDREAIARATAEAEALGVADHVRFVGIQADPVSWFALMDVFVLPSREDPFPLVCLEAEAVGCPVVAFDNGGMPELLTQGCGLVARYPDVAGLADEVRALLGDAQRRRSMGERGRELVREHHDVSVLAPKLWADIEPWLR